MRLWVIRHGKAEPADTATPDAARALTPRGARQAKFIAARLAHHALAKPALVLTSPAVRARDTATAICRALGIKPNIDPRLACDLPTSSALHAAFDRTRPTSASPTNPATPAAPTLALVGHNPTLAALIAHLAFGAAAPAVALRTGEAYLLVRPPPDADPPPLDAPASWRVVDQLRLD